MSNFFRLCFLSLCLILSTPSLAHDSNIATFQIRHIPGDKWIYEIMSPLAALDMSLQTELGPDSVIAELSLDDPAYKKALIKHLKQGFNITAFSNRSDKNTSEEGTKLSLGAGRIKLDAHLSILMFEIRNMPETPAKLTFHISSMSQNPSQINLLRLIDGQRNKKYILSQKNNFSGSDQGFFVPVITEASE